MCPWLGPEAAGKQKQWNGSAIVMQPLHPTHRVFGNHPGRQAPTHVAPLSVERVECAMRHSSTRLHHFCEGYVEAVEEVVVKQRGLRVYEPKEPAVEVLVVEWRASSC
jgi:hypothetical protein